MNFIETRGNDGSKPVSVSFSQAILSPMSSFGGIYAPEQIPRLADDFLAEQLQKDYKSLARAVLAAFQVDLPEALVESALVTYDGFDDPTNPVPVVPVAERLHVSELYHGPTRAFKDMALQPFGVILSGLAQARNEHYLIMAATSGDTGPAALDTFRNKPNIKVACLYPDGGTSDVQRLQMVTENADNLKVIGIHGNFDDAQAALKRLLGSDVFRATLVEKHTQLSAANSVNFGRIIFQLVYHIHSYLELVRKGHISLGEKVNLVVPSGNFGNALGGYYAWQMGLPVEKIVIASNANNVLTDLINTGAYDLRQRQLIGTSSPAMDILKSSNVERVLFHLFGAERTRELMRQLDEEQHYQLTADEQKAMQSLFCADFCTDEEGKAYIKDYFEQGYLMDPHTATCMKAHARCCNQALHAIVYSTAEWTKFSPTIANALTGETDAHDIDALKTIARLAHTPIPARINELFDKPIVQQTLVDKEDIEREVLAFL
ncbi:threonine synthase [Thiolapillus brandeum]|uniref:Threonine synthase n=1 Tax=Thiolapillus brandeum TaxID=1076588 RepID=A0A7U6JHV4_9GAMM|nr:threonine synthase [Thiolapillus brandeum]BAO44706.1 threonine synthase [Thiolapillus brandeum]